MLDGTGAVSLSWCGVQPKSGDTVASTGETVGQIIAHYRREAGLTISDLAKETGLSKSYLSELESGNGSAQNPSAKTLYVIAKALGVAMADLLGEPVLIEADHEIPSSLLEFAKS